MDPTRNNGSANPNLGQNPPLGMGFSPSHGPGTGMSVDYFQNLSPSSFGTLNMSMNPHSFQQQQQAQLNVNPNMNSFKMNSNLKSSLSIPVNGMSFTSSPGSLTPPIHDGVFSTAPQHQHQMHDIYAGMQAQHLNQQLASHHQHMINSQAMHSSGRNHNAFSTNTPNMNPLGGLQTGHSSGFQGNISPGGNAVKTKIEVPGVNRKLMGNSHGNTLKVSHSKTGKCRVGVGHSSGDNNSSDNRRKWGTIEDKKLRAAVKKHGEKNWKAIADEVPGRNHVQCLQRWKKVLRPGLVKGHWTEEEDEQLRKVVKAGFKNWGEVALKIQGRTPKQCRERWSCNLDPNISREKWTPEEDRKLLEAQEKLGNKWSKIGAYLPGRTENAIKTRAKSLARAQLKAWTPAEDKIIITAKTSLGMTNTRASAWSKIAEMLPARSKNAVKNRWKELKENGLESVEKTVSSLKRMNVDDHNNSKDGILSGNKRSKQTPTPPLGTSTFSVPKKEDRKSDLNINIKPEQKLLQQQQQQPQQQKQLKQQQLQQPPHQHSGSYIQHNHNSSTSVVGGPSPNVSGFQNPTNANPFYNHQQPGFGGQMVMQQHQQGKLVHNNIPAPGTTPPLIPGISNTPSPSQLMVTASLASRFSSLGVSPGFLLPGSNSGGQLSSPIAAAAGSFGQNMHTMSTTPTNFYGTTPPALPSSFNDTK